MKRFLGGALTGLTLLAAGCAPPAGREAPPTPQVRMPISQTPAQPQPPERYSLAGRPAAKVALLLPLSGESASLGNAMLDAASLALYDKFLTLPDGDARSNVILVPKDSGNSPATAARATQEALDQGATLILGPLFGPLVESAAKVARARGVSLITFSNSQSVAAPGVFVYGFLPDQQVERAAEFAFLRHKLDSFAALAPNDGYGKAVTDALANAGKQRGFPVIATELYSPRAASNLEAAVMRLAASYKSAEGAGKFKALFIADGGAQAKIILDTLTAQEVNTKDLTLIGTGLWDDEAALRVPGLVGGLFASSPPDRYDAFKKRFHATYGYEPQRVASLAYDAVALATALALSPQGANYSPSALTDPNGFLGPANGLFRLLPSGLTERGLAVMEITPSGFKVVDPAPRTF